MRIPFGIHKGKSPSEVPLDYLKFLVEGRIGKGLKGVIMSEIKRREGSLYGKWVNEK